MTLNEDDIIYIVEFVATFLCSLIVFLRTHSIKKSIKILEEKMAKYKTYDGVVSTPSKKQEFKETIPDYVLDTSTNELVRLEQDKNVQTRIQSLVESCLERALERFLAQEAPADPEILREDYSQKVDDLATIGAAMEAAEEYRERFNLPDTASYADIYAAVDKEAQRVKAELEKINKPKEEAKKDEIPSEKTV